jgi:hypothetical protein
MLQHVRAPVDETSGDETSGDYTSGDDTSDDDTSGDDTSGDDTSDERKEVFGKSGLVRHRRVIKTK